jgi:hypothetical protein
MILAEQNPLERTYGWKLVELGRKVLKMAAVRVLSRVPGMAREMALEVGEVLAGENA